MKADLMRVRRCWLGLGLLLAIGAWPPAARGQARTPARDRVGRVIVKPLTFPPEIAADERPHVRAWVDRITDILRRVPALAQPRGFDVVIEARIEWHDLDGQLDSKAPKYVGGVVSAALNPYEDGPKGPIATDRDRAATLTLAVNDLSAVSVGQTGMRGVTADDADAEFLLDPPGPFETRHGLPTYHDANETESWTLLTRAPRSMFAAITREGYVRFWIDSLQQKAGRPLAALAPPPSKDPAVIAAWQEAQRRMAAIGQTVNEAKAGLQQQLDGLNKQLGAMSAADRKAPVYVSNNGPDAQGRIEFLKPGARDAQPVVRLNPALMDGRVARWTPQTLAVGISADEHWTELAGMLDEGLDWMALQALLEQGPK